MESIANAAFVDMDKLLDPKTFVGRAPQQVESFVKNEVEPALEKYRDHLAKDAVAAELTV